MFSELPRVLPQPSLFHTLTPSCLVDTSVLVSYRHIERVFETDCIFIATESASLQEGKCLRKQHQHSSQEFVDQFCGTVPLPKVTLSEDRNFLCFTQQQIQQCSEQDLPCSMGSVYMLLNTSVPLSPYSLGSWTLLTYLRASKVHSWLFVSTSPDIAKSSICGLNSHERTQGMSGWGQFGRIIRLGPIYVAIEISNRQH